MHSRLLNKYLFFFFFAPSKYLSRNHLIPAQCWGLSQNSFYWISTTVLKRQAWKCPCFHTRKLRLREVWKWQLWLQSWVWNTHIPPELGGATINQECDSNCPFSRLISPHNLVLPNAISSCEQRQFENAISFFEVWSENSPIFANQPQLQYPELHGWGSWVRGDMVFCH